MIKIKRSQCSGCRICMAICSWAHFGENSTKRSCIVVEDEWPETPVIQVCLACKKHECVNACPNDALRWDNWVCLDQKLCDSCGICVEACPVNGIKMDPVTVLPLICDTCRGEFKCVQWCPAQAIERRN